MQNSNTRVPHARSKDLITQQVEGELVVFDKAQDKAHVLNPTAALVWQNCDGKRTVSEVAQIVAEQTGTPAQDGVVWYALAQLHEQELLEDAVRVPSNVQGLTRRQFIGRFALAAAVIPVVKTLQAPTPQQASSCSLCNPLTGLECCNGDVCCLATSCVPAPGCF